LIKLSEQFLELVSFFQKASGNLISDFSLVQGRLKIKKQFAHAQKVLITFFISLLNKYSAGDPIPKIV
jgi:hypothetical protein